MEQQQERLEEPVKQDVDNAMKADKGLVVWRCNKFTLELVRDNVGTFFSGDCYIVLSFNQKSASKPNAFVHFWLGNHSSQDEQGYVAIMAMLLDDYVESKWGLQSLISREVEGEEEGKFLSHFKDRYTTRKGGYDSGFKKVTQTFEPHLYEVKGSVIPRTREVECKTSSLDSDDCYILDTGPSYGVFILKGKKCNINERTKTIRIARRFAEGEPLIVEEERLNEDPQIKQILQKCLGVSRTRAVKFEHVKAHSDEEHERSQGSVLKLYQVSDEFTNHAFREVSAIRQASLESGDCFILTTGSKVFVWKGSKASKKERLSAINIANEFINAANMSKNAKIEIMPEHAESADFTACFSDWKVKDETNYANVNYEMHGRKTSTAKSAHMVTDFRTLYHKERAPIPDPYDDDDGSGECNIYLVDPDRKAKKNEGKPEELIICKVDKKKFVFNSGDSYLIVYTFPPTAKRNRKNVLIYYWIGNDSDQAERGNAALLAVELDEREHAGGATQIRVFEGKEPLHFMKIFGGYIKIKQSRFDGNDTRLYHVRGKENHVKVVEVSVTAANLNSNDCFILMSEKRHLYVWKGNGSLGDELEKAKLAASEMYPSLDQVVVPENNVPNEFWKSIGGKKSYIQFEDNSADTDEEKAEREPRLFHMYNIGHGLQGEEVHNFSQDDLIDNDRDVFILDTYTKMYIWVGANCTPQEKRQTIQSINTFIEHDDTPRRLDDIEITTVSQGFEPLKFKSFFGAWEDHRVAAMSDKDARRLHIEDKRLECNVRGLRLVSDIPISKFYSYDDLKGKTQEELPAEVIVEHKEMYLKNEDFERLFKMSKEKFLDEPEWKRIKFKKELGLF